jgi:hypothetical protein
MIQHWLNTPSDHHCNFRADYQAEQIHKLAADTGRVVGSGKEIPSPKMTSFINESDQFMACCFTTIKASIHAWVWRTLSGCRSLGLHLLRCSVGFIYSSVGGMDK